MKNIKRIKGEKWKTAIPKEKIELKERDKDKNENKERNWKYKIGKRGRMSERKQITKHWIRKNSEYTYINKMNKRKKNTEQMKN